MARVDGLCPEGFRRETKGCEPGAGAAWWNAHSEDQPGNHRNGGRRAVKVGDKRICTKCGNPFRVRAANLRDHWYVCRYCMAVIKRGQRHRALERGGYCGSTCESAMGR